MNDHSPLEPPEKWFPFLGLIVVRKADLLAAAAFVLALSTAVYQGAQFARGAEVTLFHPDTVYFYFDEYPNGDIVTRVAGQLSLTNSGESYANAVLRDLVLIIRAGDYQSQPGDLRFEEYWFSFAKVSRTGRTGFKVDPKSAAHPLVIKGSSAQSKMVTFAPRIKECPAKRSGTKAACDLRGDYVSDSAFLNAMTPGKVVTLEFIGHIFGTRKKVRSICGVQVTEDLISLMAENKWYSARCLSVK